jgi:ATP-dependent RNA helicase DHX57
VHKSCGLQPGSETQEAVLIVKMVKKGKDKSTPAPAATPAASQSKGKNQKAKLKPAEDDFIVFTTGDKDPKNKRGGGPAAKSGPSGSDAQQEEGALGPPKPTVKQIIGGASWTGKLPVNMLSEHCQKQKWDRPDYHTVSYHPMRILGF